MRVYTLAAGLSLLVVALIVLIFSEVSRVHKHRSCIRMRVCVCVDLSMCVLCGDWLSMSVYECVYAR